MKSGTGILPVCFTGVSPVRKGRLEDNKTLATHGQDAHATTRRLLTHVLRVLSLRAYHPTAGILMSLSVDAVEKFVGHVCIEGL